MSEFYFCKCSDVKKTVETISLNGGGAVLLDAKAVCSATHFDAALRLAEISFESGENISEDMENEILLYVSRQTHVRKAIEISGAKDGKPALIAVFEKGKKIDFSKLEIEKIEMKFCDCAESELKKKIEEMAISRV